MRAISVAVLFLVVSSSASAQDCVPPVITTAPAPLYAIMPGTTQELSVAATGTDLTYRWFFILRITLSESTVGTTPTITIAPWYPSTTYFVTVSNRCGSVTAQTRLCYIPRTSVRVMTGMSPVLTIAAYPAAGTVEPVGGNEATFQWFQGPSGDTSHPLGAPTTGMLAHLDVSASTPAQYWVRVTTRCASYDSETVTIGGAAVPALSVTLLAALGVALAGIGLMMSKRI